MFEPDSPILFIYLLVAWSHKAVIDQPQHNRQHRFTISLHHWSGTKQSAPASESHPCHVSISVQLYQVWIFHFSQNRKISKLIWRHSIWNIEVWGTQISNSDHK